MNEAKENSKPNFFHYHTHLRQKYQKKTYTLSTHSLIIDSRPENKKRIFKKRFFLFRERSKNQREREREILTPSSRLSLPKDFHFLKSGSVLEVAHTKKKGKTRKAPGSYSRDIRRVFFLLEKVLEERYGDKDLLQSWKTR